MLTNNEIEVMLKLVEDAKNIKATYLRHIDGIHNNFCITEGHLKAVLDDINEVIFGLNSVAELIKDPKPID